MENKGKIIAAALENIASALRGGQPPTAVSLHKNRVRTPDQTRIAKLNEHRLQAFVQHRKKNKLPFNEKPSDPTLDWQGEKDESEKPVATLLTGKL